MLFVGAEPKSSHQFTPSKGSAVLTLTPTLVPYAVSITFVNPEVGFGASRLSFHDRLVAIKPNKF